MKSDCMKLLYSGPSVQADLIQTVLESEDIDCHSHESIGIFAPDFCKSIFVEEQDWARASELVALLEAENECFACERDPVQIPETASVTDHAVKPFKIPIFLYILLYCVTLGLFNIYLVYRHWAYLREHDKKNSYIPPIFAALLQHLFNFMLFHRYFIFLKKDSEGYFFIAKFLPLFFFSCMAIIRYLPDDLTFMYLISGVSFIPLQYHINRSED